MTEVNKKKYRPTVRHVCVVLSCYVLHFFTWLLTCPALSCPNLPYSTLPTPLVITLHRNGNLNAREDG